jgi:ketosteroid isomerase-like protein
VNRTGLARGLALAAGVLAAYLVWGWLVTSTEDRVREAVDGLAATLSSRAADPLAQVTALGQLRQRLAEDVVVTSASGAEVRGRDAVAGLWQRIRASAQATRVRAVDVVVVVGEGGNTATVEGVAELSVDRAGGEERALHEVRMTLVAVGGDWLVSRAALVDPLTRPR